ncbi:uncharacterized protein TNIN_313091 [Trichonephila inaurata madagascariensis]|uniref:Uncharacterized protein n=1 Tax=Trichonephila inaurata madagascariensis TaxID=2747483 RepID=A0A8X6WXC7_9ARAC|nr:uncharacterized protein TNIN_313091 [Trichonephila inaurata madagascariensis]
MLGGKYLARQGPKVWAGWLLVPSKNVIILTSMGEIDPVFRDSIEENPDLQVHKVAEGMELVLKKKYAFVYMTMVIKWYAATMGSNRFRRSKNTFSTEAIGIAIQKCHPCKRSFNHV